MNEEKEAEYIGVVIEEIEILKLRKIKEGMDWDLRHHFNEALDRLRVLESQLYQRIQKSL